MIDRTPGTLFIPRDEAEAEQLLATRDHAGLPVAGPMGAFDADGRELWGFREDWTTAAYGRVAALFGRRAASAHEGAQDLAGESLLRFGKAPTIGPFPSETGEVEG